MDSGLTLIQIIAVAIIPLIFAITLHEAAHAYAANFLGDPTAKILGRTSLNPIQHIDWLGTIIIPLAMLLVSKGSVVFGWAKPVPFNWRNFKHPKKDAALTAVAGPTSNLIMAICWVILLKYLAMPMDNIFLIDTCTFGIYINLFLGVLNLIPIPPLDGSRVLAGILPDKFAAMIYKMESFGFILVILFLFSPLYPMIVIPTIKGLYYILNTIFGGV